MTLLATPALDFKIRALPVYEPIRQHTDDERYYVTPLGTCRSVTTVLSRSKDQTWIAEWRERIGAEQADFIRDTAAFRGNTMHQSIEDYFLKGIKEPPWCMLCSPYWNSIKPFILKKVRHVVALEGAVWHPRRYAGAFDCIAYLNGDDDQPTLLDWKTADKEVKPSKMYDYTLQCAAYVKAANYVYRAQGLNITRARVCVAMKDSKVQFEVLDEDALDQLFQHFIARLENVTRNYPPAFDKKQKHKRVLRATSAINAR